MFLEIGFRKQLTKSLKSPCGEVSLLVILKAWKRVTLLQTNCFIRDLQRILITVLVVLKLRTHLFCKAFFMVAFIIGTKSHDKH